MTEMCVADFVPLEFLCRRVERVPSHLVHSLPHHPYVMGNGKKRGADAQPPDEPAAKQTVKRSDIPTIEWGMDNNKLTWDLLTHFKKPINSKVLIGKQKGVSLNFSISGAVAIANYMFL